MAPKVLIIGSTGQVGSELLPLLRKRYGPSRVVAGVYGPETEYASIESPREIFDVTDQAALSEVVKRHGIDTIYHLGGVLSAVGEKDPGLAWRVNMQGLKNVLDTSVAAKVSRVFWPSSIAVYGPDAPRVNAPQDAPLNPTTMYGITKVAGELLCSYYFHKFGLDTRVLRYPGLISSRTPPGGGTTDYAVAMFYAALRGEVYTCFVRADTVLPMMYMPDALEATQMLMEAAPSVVLRHSGYNLAATSFSAGELYARIRKHVPGFKCVFVPDSRQKIADSWPESIDDSEARKDWGWSHKHDLEALTTYMIEHLGARLRVQKGR
jgi:nucleoside-diphosphate-sugar epimerase